MDKQEIFQYIDDQYENMVKVLEELVRIESQSANVEGVKQMAAHLDTYVRAMDMTTKKYEFENAGPCLYAETKETELPAILFMGHMDTVHKAGSWENLFSIEDGIVRGPGAYDMKGGIVIALLAIKALQHAGYDKRQFKLCLAGDEEVAHALSKSQAIQAYKDASQHTAIAFNCESALVNGDIVTRRKGGGVSTLKVWGKASHAGNAPLAGASAIMAAAKKMQQIEGLNDYEGAYFNCGKITGGQGSNIIPDYCEVVVGLRFATNDNYTQAVKDINAIAADNEDERIKAEYNVDAIFNAMEELPKTQAFFDLYSQAAIELGCEAPKAVYSGGCSDAAYTTMEGVPTLCGVGILGEFNHTLQEYALIESIKLQAKKIVSVVLALPDDF